MGPLMSIKPQAAGGLAAYSHAVAIHQVDLLLDLAV